MAASLLSTAGCVFVEHREVGLVGMVTVPDAGSAWRWFRRVASALGERGEQSGLLAAWLTPRRSAGCLASPGVAGSNPRHPEL